jgi:hypothetical protein
LETGTEKVKSVRTMARLARAIVRFLERQLLRSAQWSHPVWKAKPNARYFRRDPRNESSENVATSPPGTRRG